MPQPETIDHVLEVFLRDQRLRLSERTYRNYADVIRLLRNSLNTYAYSSLSAADAKRWQKAFDAGDEEAFCHLRILEAPPPDAVGASDSDKNFLERSRLPSIHGH